MSLPRGWLLSQISEGSLKQWAPIASWDHVAATSNSSGSLLCNLFTMQGYVAGQTIFKNGPVVQKLSVPAFWRCLDNCSETSTSKRSSFRACTSRMFVAATHRLSLFSLRALYLSGTLFSLCMKATTLLWLCAIATTLLWLCPVSTFLRAQLSFRRHIERSSLFICCAYHAHSLLLLCMSLFLLHAPLAFYYHHFIVIIIIINLLLK
jgi:hypothetical protein